MNISQVLPSQAGLSHGVLLDCPAPGSVFEIYPDIKNEKRNKKTGISTLFGTFRFHFLIVMPVFIPLV